MPASVGEPNVPASVGEPNVPASVGEPVTFVKKRQTDESNPSRDNVIIKGLV